MLKNIPKNRLLIYLLCGGVIPIVFVLFILFSHQSELNEAFGTLQQIQEAAFTREKKQATNMAVRSHFKDADHFYIDKQLETLSFLEPEVESLQKILQGKTFIDDELVRKRLDLLTGTGNSMVFSEGVVESTPFFQETTETLVHPVEVNGKDLQKILSRIEGIEIGEYTPSPNRPQLIILDFKLDRKASNEKNEVFLLNLKLLKREFL